MKRIKKILLRFIIGGAVFMISLYIGVFLYYRFGWRNHYPASQVESLISNLQQVPPLSDSLYAIYDQLYDDRHERVTWRYWKDLGEGFIMPQSPLQNNWQYEVALREPHKGFRYKMAPMALAFKINSVIPPAKCFDYIMRENYSEYCRRFKIKDTIDTLYEREHIIRFIIAGKNPWYYYSHPEAFQHHIDSVKKLLNSQKE